ncbi:hypothetical protein [Shimia sp.]|uniref:hypothetical protein n=1 Tax=Shimia sp. TaxID=1954381 RepID=UPI0035617545
MTDWTLTKTRLLAGIWEGALTGPAGAVPEIVVSHLSSPIEGVEVTEDAAQKRWVVRIPIPAEAISDGVQTLVITEQSSGAFLDRITIIAGDVLADDLLAEIDLLRAELDLLKGAFRRHCSETR